MTPAGDNFVSMKALYDAPIVFAVCVEVTQLAKERSASEKTNKRTALRCLLFGMVS